MGGGGRTQGGLLGKRNWRGMENIIFIKFEVKKYSHTEPESLLQEFHTNSVAIRCLLTDLSALILNDNILDSICT